MEMWQRIIEARQHAELSQSALARELNLTPQSVQQWENPKSEGGTEPRPQRVRELASICEVNYVWLATGEGSMTEQVSAHPLPPAPGSTAHAAVEAAWALLIEGEYPSVEKVRLKLGRGSPNTINRVLRENFWPSVSAELQTTRSRPGVPDWMFDLVRELYDRACDEADEAYRSRRRELERQEEEAHARIETAETTRRAAEKRADRAEAQLEEERTRIQQLQTELAAAKAAREELRAQVQANEHRLATMVQEHERHTEQLRSDALERESRLEQQLQARVQDLRSAEDAHREEIDHLNASWKERLEKEEHRSDAREEGLVAQLEEQRALRESAERAAERRETRLRETLTTCEQNLEQSRRKAAEHQARLSERDASVKALSQEVDHLRQLVRDFGKQATKRQGKE